VTVPTSADTIGRPEIRPVQPKARFQNIKHADDPARFTRVGDLNRNVLEQRFLFEPCDEFLVIDKKCLFADMCSRSKTDVLDFDYFEV
jgi:hypothetical protein